VLAVLLRIGWSIKREAHGSHRILSRPGWPTPSSPFTTARRLARACWLVSRRRQVLRLTTCDSGVAVIFGVDELMDMGRTAVNLIGNCLATVVVARWEGEFDDRRAAVFGTSKEIELDLKEGEVAFAEVVRQGD
jgi:hypothetical protein